MECVGVVPLSIVTPGVVDLQSRPDPGAIEQRTRTPHGVPTLSHEPETLHPNTPARDHPDYSDGCPALVRLRKNEKAAAFTTAPGHNRQCSALYASAGV